MSLQENQTSETINNNAATDGLGETASKTSVSDDAKLDATRTDGPSYDTHQRLLREKKKLSERLEALETEKRTKEDDELKAKEDYKKLLQNREEELAQVKQRAELLETERKDSIKLDALLKALPTNLPSKCWKLLDIDEVIVDPDTGRPDEASVQKYADIFYKEWPELFHKKINEKLPSDAPGSGSIVPDVEQWSKLGTAKEMQDRLKDVYERDIKKYQEG